MTRKAPVVRPWPASKVRDPANGAGNRVLIIYDGVPPWRQGGAETRLGSIARELARLGWDVSWLGLAPPDQPRVQVRDGVTIVAAGREPTTRSGRRRPLSRIARWLWALATVRLPPADVVILGQVPWVHYPVVRRRLPQRVPIVLDCWEVWDRFWTDYYGRLAGAAGRGIEGHVLRHADAVAAISRRTRDAAAARGTPAERLFDIPNGVDPPAPAHPAPPRRPREIAYFGRLVPHKNVDLLVMAFARVATVYGDARLVIIGDGGERPRLEALTATLGIAGSVTFLGAVEHSAAMRRLQEAGLFVQPSTSEGGGSIAVHEAHACGLPVVAFRHPQGIDPALIREGGSGWWLGRADAGTLADCLIARLAEPERIEAMRDDCRAAAVGLDWAAIARAYEPVLLTAMTGRR